MLKLFSTRIHEIGGVLPRHKKEKQSLSLMDIFEKLLEEDTKAPSASYLRRSFGYAQLSFFLLCQPGLTKKETTSKVWESMGFSILAWSSPLLRIEQISDQILYLSKMFF